ncbi:MAG: PIG-L family deacetylase, partial [Chloroflexi bacterium]|nr:PIG-L family deacetylase [Chloroflexota bacterium]
MHCEKVEQEGPVAQLEQFDEIPERAMVVCAHPDDAEIGAGGTTSLWARNGCEISYVVCTTGSSGSNDESMTSDRIVDIRRQEQEAAADVIGVTNLVMLPYPDGMLETNREFLGDMVKAIRTYRPDVIFTHDPFRFDGFNHRDHRNTGITVQDAVYPYARDHLHCPEQLEEGLAPHLVS